MPASSAAGPIVGESAPAGLPSVRPAGIPIGSGDNPGVSGARGAGGLPTTSRRPGAGGRSCSSVRPRRSQSSSHGVTDAMEQFPWLTWSLLNI